MGCCFTDTLLSIVAYAVGTMLFGERSVLGFGRSRGMVRVEVDLVLRKTYASAEVCPWCGQLNLTTSRYKDPYLFYVCP